MSYFFLIILYLTPGQSCTLPPSNNTTPCSCNTAFSPGIYAVITFPLLSFSSAHFRFPELGFFGFRVKTLMQTPFLWGPWSTCLELGITFFGISALVLTFFHLYWFIVARHLVLFMPEEDCISKLGQSLFLKMANMIDDCVLKVGCRFTMGIGKNWWPWTDRVCCAAYIESWTLLLLETCCRFLETDRILAEK